MKKIQGICIAMMILGGLGMGGHLFLADGIAHPTHVLTVFAAITGIGMVGNLIVLLCRLAKEEKEKKRLS